MRRIKSVSITIPCVAGPYAGVTARLTLGKNYIRLKPTTDLTDPEAPVLSHPIISFIENPAEEVRQNLSYLQSIATSTAQNDSGMFNLNFNDERYLPFEGAGVADSEWTLELPEEYRSFDYRTIGDVILNINYTAKDGGDIFKGAVVRNLDELFDVDNDQLFPPIHQRIFSLKHEFGKEWHELLNDTDNVKSVIIPLTKEHYPFILKNKDLEVLQQHAIIQFKSEDVAVDDIFITISDWNSLQLSENTIEGDITMKSGRYNTGAVDAGKPAVLDAQIQLSSYTLIPTPGTPGSTVQVSNIENIFIIFDYKVS